MRRDDPRACFLLVPGVGVTQELEDRLESNGQKLEWADITRDLISLQYAEVQQDGKRFLLRSEAQGTCGRVFAAAGVALPPTVQQIEAS